MLQLMYTNLEQFSNIIQHKDIQQSYYIQNIDAVCIIVQDWTKKCIDSKSIVIFYTVLNYKTKLTNSIHFMIFCTNNIHLFYKEPPLTKQEKKSKLIRKMTNFLDYQYTQSYYCPEFYIRPTSISQFACISFSKDTQLLFDRLNLSALKDNNWKIRQQFATLHHGLKNHFVTNKAKTTNKAGQVLFNRRFNRHISQFV